MNGQQTPSEAERLFDQLSRPEVGARLILHEQEEDLETCKRSLKASKIEAIVMPELPKRARPRERRIRYDAPEWRDRRPSRQWYTGPPIRLR